jgi:hypothetical protein
VSGTHACDRTTIVPVSGCFREGDRALPAQLGVSRFVRKDASLASNLAAVLLDVRRSR